MDSGKKVRSVPATSSHLASKSSNYHPLPHKQPFANQSYADKRHLLEDREQSEFN